MGEARRGGGVKKERRGRRGEMKGDEVNKRGKEMKRKER